MLTESERSTSPGQVTAVVLAAGVGERLMPLTRNTPKSLIDLGDGYTLLERQLDAFATAGIHNLVLVTGYKSEQIVAKVQDYRDFSIRIAFNPFYRLANNIVSAWMGLEVAQPPALLVNGDDLFHPKVLRAVLGSSEEITMVVSRKATYDGDDMKVRLQGDQVIDVGKDLDPSETDAESIGMILLRERGFERIRTALVELLRDEENFHLFYLHALAALMRAHHRVGFCEVDQREWSEVDFHPDVDTMRSLLRSDLPGWE